MPTIYKIADRQLWETAKINDEYNGSSDDIRDGFIHFSTKNQLAATLIKHFHGKNDILLIAIEAEPLGKALKWETSRKGDLFPHLYAPLPTSAILWEKPIEQNQDGTHIMPELTP